jgi:hypothetical protein
LSAVPDDVAARPAAASAVSADDEVGPDMAMQRVCLYCGLAFPLIFFLGWGLISGFMLPLHAPGDSAQEIQDFYADNPTPIRIGLILGVFSAAFIAPFGALVGMHMRRIEGRFSPLAYSEMLLAAANVILILVPCMIFVVVAFRPPRDAELIQLLNDFGWLLIIGGFSPAFLQSIAVGLCVIRDKRAKPIIPRWVAYFNFWVAAVILPGAIVMIAKSGPFAWNGVLGFWIPATAFGGWFIVMFFVMKGVLRDQERELAERVPLGA